MNEKLKKYKTTVICLLLLFCMEASLVVYSSTIHFSPGQLSDYEQAKKDLVQMQHEIQSIRLAEREDLHVREGLSELLMARPDGCRLLEVSVGNLHDADADSNVKDLYAKKLGIQTYAYVTVIPKDDAALQTFRENITSSPMFADTSIDSIYQDSDGRRVVRLSIRSVQP